MKTRTDPSSPLLIDHSVLSHKFYAKLKIEVSSLQGWLLLN